LSAESAVNKQMGESFSVLRTELTRARVRPATTLKIVGGQSSSSLVHQETHKELAPSWGHGFLDRTSAGDTFVGHKEELVRATCGQAALVRMSPDQGTTIAAVEVDHPRGGGTGQARQWTACPLMSLIQQLLHKPCAESLTKDASRR
jgi:hypothetical protein